IYLEGQGRTGERKTIGAPKRVGRLAGGLLGLSLQPLPDRPHVSLNARGWQVLAARERIPQIDLDQPIGHDARVPTLEPCPLRMSPLFQRVRQGRDGSAVARHKAAAAAARVKARAAQRRLTVDRPIYQGLGVL